MLITDKLETINSTAWTDYGRDLQVLSKWRHLLNVMMLRDSGYRIYKQVNTYKQGVFTDASTMKELMNMDSQVSASRLIKS